ncbi:MAG: PAS domain S-box protein, partial [Acidobacteriota bacterium]|nr:PAS domain S-box protein [Acidobacteriota bacterium]
MAVEVSGRALDATDLIQQLGDAVVATDLDGTVTLFNGAAERLFGWTADAVVGRNIAMLTPEPIAARAQRDRRRVLRGETRRLLGNVLTSSGAACAIELTLAPVRDTTGTVVGSIGVARDATTAMLRERQFEFMSQLVGETDTVAVVGTDRGGLINLFNRGAEELLGYTAQEVVGRLNGLALFDPEEIERRAQVQGGSAFAKARSGEKEEGIWTYVRKDGSKLEVLLTIRAIFDRLGEIEGFLAFGRDLSEMQRAEIEMQRAEIARAQAEERFRTAFEHAPIGLAITSLHGATAGHWTQTNPAFARMLGWEPGELDGASIDAMTHPDDRHHTESLLSSLRDQRPIVVEKRFARKDGSFVWAYVSSTPVPSPRGEPTSCAVTQVIDISERRNFEQQLRYMADHDPLTGLYNRRRFEAELERALELARARDEHAALLVLDLDGFKAVNDRFGHTVGDDLVTHIGGLLRRSVRKSDFVARLGGDEFAIILRDCKLGQASEVAEKVLEAVRTRGLVVTPQGTARVTTSIGVCLHRPGCTASPDELAVSADSALYEAKAEGRNCYAVYSSEGRRRGAAEERDSWFSRLRRALDEERFVLFAQPIVPIYSAGLPRYEVLVRMLDDSGGLVPPGAFLLNAERLELIGEIDRWVLQRAVALLHQHARSGNDFSLSVNLSGKTMNDLELADDLGEMIKQNPIPAGRLVVEVTETAAIVNIERARELSQQLRVLGCLFALDDFGSGFSSFYYLKHLEFDYLKIDGEFIVNLIRSATDQLLVQAVVDIARGLGTQTVAEFVGDDETVELLRHL